MSCFICGESPAPYMTGGPRLTPEELEEIRAFNEALGVEFHTGHLPTRLLRLPIHHYCEQHKPKDARVDPETEV